MTMQVVARWGVCWTPSLDPRGAATEQDTDRAEQSVPSRAERTEQSRAYRAERTKQSKCSLVCGRPTSTDVNYGTTGASCCTPTLTPAPAPAPIERESNPSACSDSLAVTCSHTAVHAGGLNTVMIYMSCIPPFRSASYTY